MPPVPPPPAHAVDPACGARVETASAGLPLLWKGARYWFCSPACRLAFKRDPDRWAAARPEAGVPAAPAVPARSRAAGPFRVLRGAPPEPDGTDA